MMMMPNPAPAAARETRWQDAYESLAAARIELDGGASVRDNPAPIPARIPASAEYARPRARQPDDKHNPTPPAGRPRIRPQSGPYLPQCPNAKTRLTIPVQ